MGGETRPDGFEVTVRSVIDGFPDIRWTIEDQPIAIYRIEGGKAVQAWIRSDRLGFLQQLGRVPTDLTQLADAGD